MSREFWDSRYGEPGYAYGTEPNAFLRDQSGRLAPGSRVLVVGDGEGRNGVWLATRGHEVLSVDASAVGLAKARRLAAERGVVLQTEEAELSTWRWPVAAFDAVVSIYLHFRPDIRARMHAAMLAALKPAGLLILEAFTPDQLKYSSGGPRDREMLYTSDLLRQDMSAGEILQLEERVTELD
ncbi:MAG: SAM-dependent methyltransferase, partial [Candidatus Muproteobacteria bacterium RBG_16_62_13]